MIRACHILRDKNCIQASPPQENVLLQQLSVLQIVMFMYNREAILEQDEVRSDYSGPHENAKVVKRKDNSEPLRHRRNFGFLSFYLSEIITYNCTTAPVSSHHLLLPRNLAPILPRVKKLAIVLRTVPYFVFFFTL